MCIHAYTITYLFICTHAYIYVCMRICIYTMSTHVQQSTPMCAASHIYMSQVKHTYTLDA